MQTIQSARNWIQDHIKSKYSTPEAASIATELLMFVTGKSKIQLYLNEITLLTSDQQFLLSESVARLQADEPIQYVTGETSFYGLNFMVNRHVLIPRPETEELVKWIIDDLKQNPKKTLLDVGTGSGCIAIAVKKNVPALKVYALDISEEALVMAKKNAKKNEVDIHFFKANIFDTGYMQKIFNSLPEVIASNPPYVMASEQSGMDSRVRNFEPTLALFVPDNDPLKYYLAIMGMASRSKGSNSNCSLYLEINEKKGEQIVQMANRSAASEVTVRKDLFGKDRMIRVRFNASENNI